MTIADRLRPGWKYLSGGHHSVPVYKPAVERVTVPAIPAKIGRHARYPASPCVVLDRQSSLLAGPGQAPSQDRMLQPHRFVLGPRPKPLCRAAWTCGPTSRTVRPLRQVTVSAGDVDGNCSSSSTRLLPGPCSEPNGGGLS